MMDVAEALKRLRGEAGSALPDRNEFVKRMRTEIKVFEDAEVFEDATEEETESADPRREELLERLATLATSTNADEVAIWFLGEGDTGDVGELAAEAGVKSTKRVASLAVRGSHAVDCEYHVRPESLCMYDWIHSCDFGSRPEDLPIGFEMDRFACLVEGSWDTSLPQVGGLMDEFVYKPDSIANGMWEGKVDALLFWKVPSVGN